MESSDRAASERALHGLSDDWLGDDREGGGGLGGECALVGGGGEGGLP